MYQLHTDQQHFDKMMELLGDSVRHPTDGDVYFNAFLARLNATNEIITLASSTGQVYVKSKQMLYVHMAVTPAGAEMIAHLYHAVQRRIHEEWESGKQPLGVTIKPTAIQVRFNYYQHSGIWLQAMSLQCHGIINSVNQSYIVDLLHKAHTL